MIDFDQTIVYQFLNLLIMLVLLNLLLFKPILSAIKKRQSAIQSLGEKAEAGQAEIESYAKAYEEHLKEKKRPITEERDSLLKDAQSASMKVIEAARQDLTQELSKVKDTVRAEADKALATLSAESDRLSSEIVEKLIKRSS
jgi:F-type H+-transporting ATPase subunit b